MVAGGREDEVRKEAHIESLKAQIRGVKQRISAAAKRGDESAVVLLSGRLEATMRSLAVALEGRHDGQCSA